MDKIYNFLNKIAKLVIIIGLFFACFVYIIVYNAGSPNNFFPFVANGMELVLMVLLYGLPPVLILLKGRENEGRIFLIIVMAYWLIDMCFALLASGALVNTYSAAISKVYGVFAFIGGCLLFTCFVFFVLMRLFNLKLYPVLNILVLTMVCYFFIVFIVGLIRYIINDYNWESYLTLILNYLVLPFVFLCSGAFLTKKQPKAE